MSVTLEQLQKIIDRLPEAQSLRAIAAELGLHHITVQKAAKPFAAVLQAAGALPVCSCGKPRFHRYGCKAKLQRKRRDGSPTARSAMIIELMLEGMPVKQIARMFGIDPAQVRKERRRLSNEQMAVVQAHADRSAQRGPAFAARGAAVRRALIEGRSYPTIQRALSVSTSTVKRHVAALTPAEKAERANAVRARLKKHIGARDAKGRVVAGAVRDAGNPIEWRMAA